MCIFFFFGKMLFFDRIMIIVVDCSINGHKFFLVYHSAMSLSSSFHEKRNPFLHPLNPGVTCFGQWDFCAQGFSRC